MKKLLTSIFLLLTTFSTFAVESYKLMYECRVIGASTLAKDISVFGNFTSGEIQDQPGLVIISDGLKTKAFTSKVSLQGNVHPWQKATVVISASAIGYENLDLAITIDLTNEHRISIGKKSNALIGLVSSGTFQARKMTKLECEHIF